MAIPRVLLDREEKYEKRALTLRTIGGIFFIEALIVCEWIWMGWRAGSALWFWATAGFGLLGLICFGAAEYQNRKAMEIVREEFVGDTQVTYEPEHRRAA
jgi:hypothetical protein